ncbi:MAG: Mfa1 family fimbria major subunit [Parabacteroides sp.]|nr:Mfa1 family fimbria major subunit [Parabacteroides sp.]
MKTRFKYFMMAAVLAAGFTSCSDSDDEGGGVEGQGKPTTMTIKFSAPVSTYASNGDDNAIDAETVLGRAAVFVYSTSGAYQTHKELSQSDFVYDDVNHVYNAQTNVDASTGEKLIYVGINLPDGMVNAIKSGGVYAEYVLSNPNLLYSAIVSGGTSGGFAMFNEKIEKKTLVEDASQNVFEINVKRMAAKVTVQETADLEKTGISKVTIGDLDFCMGLLNTKIFPMQKLSGSTVVDPNYTPANTSGIGDQPSYYQDFVNEFRASTSDPINVSAYLPVNTAATAVESRNVKYAPENTSENHYRGESTFASVRAKFTPEKFASYDGANLTETENTANAQPALIYLVTTEGGEHYYFTDQTEANDYASSLTNATLYTPYRDCYCYYTVFLNKGGSNDVLRNDYYAVSITAINSIGYPDPEVVEPGRPISKDTQITVNVTVQNWNLVNDPQVLEK